MISKLSDEHLATLSSPSGLSRYEITELCCDTRHSAIFLGRVKDNELPVLIKVAKRQDRASAEWLEHDYQIGRTLQASCAAKILSIEQTETGQAVVYVDEGARPLTSIEKNGLLDIEAVLTIGSTLADAVADLHRQGLVHANLNATTVWYNEGTAAVCIMDFSCAQRAAQP